MRLNIRNKENMTPVHKWALKGGSIEGFEFFHNCGFNNDGLYGTEISDLLRISVGKNGTNPNHPTLVYVRDVLKW